MSLTSENWVSILPFALLRARYTPYQDVHKAKITNHSLLKSLQVLQVLQQTQRTIHQMGREAVSLPAHKFQLGKLVWIEDSNQVPGANMKRPILWSSYPIQQ